MQFLRPDSNITQTNITGGYAEIDESSASDSDKAYVPASAASTLEVGLSNPSATPGPGTTTIRYRLGKTDNTGALNGSGAAITATLALYQGATLIAADAGRTPGGAYTDYTFSPDMSAVTDWNDLRLRLTQTSSGGRAVAISFAEVEAPDPPSSGMLMMF